MNLLLTRRRRIEQQCTANRNALNALVRQADLGLDTRLARVLVPNKGVRNP